jgi:hypothetical protein
MRRKMKKKKVPLTRTLERARKIWVPGYPHTVDRKDGFLVLLINKDQEQYCRLTYTRSLKSLVERVCSSLTFFEPRTEILYISPPMRGIEPIYREVIYRLRFREHLERVKPPAWYWAKELLPIYETIKGVEKDFGIMPPAPEAFHGTTF